MPSFSTLAVASLFAIGAFARPSNHGNEIHKRHGYGYCLSKNEAQQVATNYGDLIAGYTDELAIASLDPEFTDYSESVNSLIQDCPQGSAAMQAVAAKLPLLGPSFTNRTQFMEGQGQQAPINFFQLNMWHSCDTVIIRWETTNTANITGVRPVVGLISMETTKAPEGNKFPYYISTVYSEFDAAAWLKNIVAAGFCGTPATANSTGEASGPIVTPSVLASLTASHGSSATGSPSASSYPATSTVL